jgi:formate dehydrogenase subunit gamma
MTAGSLDADALAEIIASFVGRAGGLIAALRAVQARVGCLPVETEAAAASAFNLTRAEVKGVISFYADFHREPKGRCVIRLCAAEACQAQGGRELERDVVKKFALQPGATSASRDLTLEHVYCLGLCSAGPAAMIGEELMARATPPKIAAAFDRRGKSAP